MCFYIDAKHPDVKIANKDIICVKRLCKNKGVLGESLYVSPYQEYSYISNFLYSNSVIGWPFIERKSFKFEFKYVINIGYHTYSSFAKANDWCAGDEVLVWYIIPEGSKYYYNEYNEEYVSNQIILKGEI